MALISMPYKGETDWETRQNIEAAAKIAALAWQRGYATICPHTNSAFFGGAVDEEVFYKGYERMVEVVDVVIAGPRWRESRGARMEVELAHKLEKEVLEYDEALVQELVPWETLVDRQKWP